MPDDIKSLVIDGDFATDPGWTQWLDYTFQLKPYFNEDANSLGFAEGLALWQAGKTAMVFGAPGVQSVIKSAQDGGMNVTSQDAGGDGDSTTAQAQAQGFRRASGLRKGGRGRVHAFLQEPENLQALYEATGNSSTNWDSSTVTSPTDQTMLEWLSEKSTAWWPPTTHRSISTSTARSSCSRR